MQSPTPLNPLKLGTRASPLAMAQAHEVRQKLCHAHGWSEEHVEIITMKTTGDQFTDRPLSAIGGKGLFTKELEIGLYDKTIDFAVHSMKDVATILPDGLVLNAILPREDVRDSFVSFQCASIKELPMGAKVGTSSLRRKAQLLRLRPDLEIVEFRGVVDTRLRKLQEEVAVATFLATAGLKRLKKDDLFQNKIASPIEIDDMLPAAAQAAIGIEIRQDDAWLGEILAPLHCSKTSDAITAERAFLRVLDGSCRTPIAAFYHDGVLKGEVLSLDGARRLGGAWKGDDPVDLGERAAKELLAQGAADVLG